jgi:spermidine/putrescine transport system substrate-binding protein
MDHNELLDKLQSGQMTRRQFKKALASVGLGLFSLPLLGKRGLAGTEDHPLIFGWEGYEEEGLHTQYAEKHGEIPNFTFFGDEEEAFAKMRAGFKPDISMPCSYKIPTWRDAGILQPIDVSRLSNFGDTITSLKDVPGIVVNGERHWVCMDWGQTSITYRTDLVDIEEESWGLLWDERYKGRLAMMDSLIDGVMVAAIYGGAKDPFNMTPDEVAMTKKLLQEQLPLLRYYSSSATDIQNGLASGEVVAAVTWNDAYSALKAEGVPVKFMEPKEGAMTWTCGLSLMTGADPAKIDKSYEAMDSMLSPAAGAYEIVEFGYGHANQKAFQLVDEATLADRGLTRNPEDRLNSGIFQEPIGNEPELQTMFEEVRTGA